jgi:hypothetical protein
MVMPADGMPSPSILIVQVPDFAYLRYIVMIFPSAVVTVLYSSQLYAGAEPKIFAPLTTDPAAADAVCAAPAAVVADAADPWLVGDAVAPAFDEPVLVHPATVTAITTHITTRILRCDTFIFYTSFCTF